MKRNNQHNDILYSVLILMGVSIITSVIISSVSLGTLVSYTLVNQTDVDAVNIHTTNVYAENIFVTNIDETNMTNTNITNLYVENIRAIDTTTTNLDATSIDITTLIIKNGDIQTSITYDGTTNNTCILPRVTGGASFVMTKGNQSVNGFKTFIQQTEFDTGIKFPLVTNTTQKVLNTYVKTTFSFLWNLGASANGTFIRIGDKVTLTFIALQGSFLVFSNITHSNAIPSIYAPATDLLLPILYIEGTTPYSLGLFVFSSPYQHIVITKERFTKFPPVTAVGFGGSTYSYIAASN